MGRGGQREGAPDLARGARLAWLRRRQVMPGLAGAAAGAQPGGY